MPTEAAESTVERIAAPLPATAVLCSHCAAEMPAARSPRADGLAFCCSGCESAYGIIHACGLDEYYRLRDELSGERIPASQEGSRFEEFDHPTFQQLYIRPVAGACEVDFYLPAIHCAACVWLIERLPQIIPGVIDARIWMARSTVRITWHPAEVGLSRIAVALDRLGYTPHPCSADTVNSVRRQAARRELGLLAIAGACAGNNMLIAIALYAGEFNGMAAEHVTLFRWASALVGMISVFGPGLVFFRGALAAIRSKMPHLDIPLALGLGVGAIGGLFYTFTGAGEVYFDSLSVLVFLLLLGRFIQGRGQRLSAERVSLLRQLTPRRAHRVDGQEVATIPIEAVREGDLLEVHVGESLPADGTVEFGTSSVDESLLTGETLPRDVSGGSAVTAGSANLSGTIRIRVTAAAERSRVGKLAQLVEGVSRERTGVFDLVHRWSGYFVVIVLVLAIATGIAWSQVSPAKAVEHVVALLVVSCPCALGLATPLAVAVAQGRAARQKILIKGSEVFERLSRPGRVWLDKTGTLTEGKLCLHSWAGDSSIASAVIAIERESKHPIARALVSSLEGKGHRADGWQAEDIRHWQGGGISGVVDGRHVEIGSARRLEDLRWRWPTELRSAVEQSLTVGHTPVVVGVDGSVVAVAGLGDQLRPEAVDAVRALRSMGWRVGILSGDHPRIVEQVARQLAMVQDDWLGSLSPEEKLVIVRAGAEQETVVMVGDGINDSAALASASVGIAVHGGAEASMNSAMVYLAEPGLMPVIELMKGSRRTLRVIHRNLVASLCYNILAAGLAVAGIITPLVAALLMPASSLTVVGLSTLSHTFGRRS